MIYLFIAIVGAFISGIVASGKNRNAVGWGALGFVFPVIGIVAICCLPAHKSTEQLIAEAELARMQF